MQPKDVRTLDRYLKLYNNILCLSLLDKIKREGPHSISRPMAPLPPPRESSKRDARKKSLDLPGKYRIHQIVSRIFCNYEFLKKLIFFMYC